MLSRQTLGRPAASYEFGGAGAAGGDTFNNRAGVQGGATIVTQYNRDNIDDDQAIDNAEIDDLRRDEQ